MLLCSLALFALIVALGLKYIYSYWERHGVPHINPQIPFGNLKTVALKTESFGIAINRLYWKTKGQLVGIYLFFRPALLIRDAHLAHRIMTTDFNYFHDRGVYHNEKDDPFSGNLFALPFKRWRDLRNKLSPLFTSGQLRNMTPTIFHVGHKLQKHLEPLAENQETVKIRQIVSCYSMEIVASVFFGFEADCINNPNDSFYQNLQEVQKPTISANFRSAAVFLCPALLKLVKTSSIDPMMIDFMTDIVTKQIEHREKTGITRKDFIQQMIELRNEDRKNNDVVLSLEQCAANTFLFYIAGSDTSTAAVSFTLYELCQNPDVMKRLQTEIDDALEKCNGEMTYEVVKGMRYLDYCVKETLRKYPGLPILNRECTKDFKVEESGIVIKKGTQVVLPLMGYGMDEQYFPEPERYNPDRFDEATKAYDEKAYFPFGEGPRNCIAFRMGELVSKIGLVLLLSKFKFEAAQGPKVDYIPTSVALIPKGGLPLKISRR